MENFISVVLSFRNEEAVLPELISRLQQTFRKEGWKYELIFVNDDSTDKSLEILLAAHRDDPSVKILNMSRKFGVAECIVAGIEYSRGDAVIYMDADLQDPPEVIPELVRAWRGGADVVYTVRQRRLGESPVKLFLTKLAYKVIHAVCDVRLPVESGDFRLLSRKATELFLTVDDRNPYVRGLTWWIGLNQTAVPYVRDARGAGETHFPIFRSFAPIREFLNGLLSFSSLLPVYFLLGGLLLAFISFVLAPFHSFFIRGVSGTLLFFTAFLAGVQLSCTGLITMYLVKLYRQVNGRPKFIVRETVGFEDDRALSSG